MVIFVPIRLFFFTYVSDHWLGSVGVISAVWAIIWILTVKGRFGFIGRLLIKKLHRLHKRKAKYGILGINIYFVFLLGSILFSLTVPVDITPTLTGLENQGITDLNSTQAEIIERGPSPAERQLSAAVFLLFGMFTNIYEYGMLMQTIDVITENWFSHFITVGFVELMESFFWFLYFGFVKKFPTGSRDPIEN